MNPNTMTFKQVFHAEYQMSHYKEPIYQVLADSRLESSLTKGQTISRSYASDVVANDMAGDGGYTPQAIVDTAETLSISYEKEASVYIKKLDELQAHLPVKQKYGSKLGNALVNQIDGDVLLKAYQGAGTILDDGSFAGTAGNGYSVTSSTVQTLFSRAMTRLRLKNTVYNKRFKSSAGMKLEVPEGMPVAIVTPEVLEAIEVYLGGKSTLLGDQISRNGYSGYFMGFEVFSSNALPWTGRLNLATAPTDGDTVTIRGVVYTFKTVLGVTPGNVLIGGSAANANTNLAALVNAPTVTTANGVALIAANARLMRNITATAAATSTSFVAGGTGTVEVDETFTAAADVWTVGKEVVHCLFGLSKSISLVIQKYPSLEENFVSRKIGRDYIAWTVYGIKVFQDQAPMLVDAAVLATTFTGASATSN